jgi:Zn-dependent metalloprotease
MKRNLIILVLIVFCGIVNAQTNNAFDIQKSENGVIKFARFHEAEQQLSIQNDTVLLKSVLNATLNDKFVKIKENTDELGITHKRFQQYYKGIKVDDIQYLTHSRNGKIEYINGDFPIISLSSIVPALNEQQALAYALNYVNAQKYKWEDEGAEAFIKQITNNANATYYPTGELVISKDCLVDTNTYCLSWKFTIASITPENERLNLVNSFEVTEISLKLYYNEMDYLLFKPIEQ